MYKLFFLLSFSIMFQFELLAQTKPDGKWKEYYDGKLIESGFYKNNMKQGLWQQYFERRVLTKVNYIDDKREGWAEYYHSNGQLSKRIYYKNDEPYNFLYISYDENGCMEDSGYVKNAFEGEFKHFNYGFLEEIRHYNNGLLNGEWRKYACEGYISQKMMDEMQLTKKELKRMKQLGCSNMVVELEIVGFYKEGEKEGEWLFYHPNGQIKIKGNFSQGQEQGEWKTFDESGKLISIDVYKDGIVIQ